MTKTARSRLRTLLLAPVLLGCLALPSPAAGQAATESPHFDVPVACRMGRDCSIQNFVDHDPGPKARDYTCGLLTYNGHDGTDFRIPDYVAMERGVAVLAAAAGVVLRVRDGMRDVSVREIGKAAIKNREAGNAVVIGHGRGWETQYSHMRKGSVAVQPGQEVAAGQPIGLIGLSGNTEFPHVHFEIRHDGREIDPFTGSADRNGCGIEGRPLWSPAALKLLEYQPTGLLNAGFAATRPKPSEARRGAYAASALPADSPVLTFWVDLFGVQAGDQETIQLLGPDGASLAEVKRLFPRHSAIAFRVVGKTHNSGPWPPGVYRAEYRLVRTVDGATRTVIEATRQVELR